MDPDFKKNLVRKESYIMHVEVEKSELNAQKRLMETKMNQFFQI
jgi:hypothetical protein